jgi:hypothetical protein
LTVIARAGASSECGRRLRVGASDAASISPALTYFVEMVATLEKAAQALLGIRKPCKHAGVGDGDRDHVRQAHQQALVLFAKNRASGTDRHQDTR